MMMKMLMGGGGGGGGGDDEKKKKNYSNVEVHRPLIWLPFNHFIFWQWLATVFIVTDIAAAAATVFYLYLHILIINIKNTACYSLTYVFT